MAQGTIHALLFGGTKETRTARPMTLEPTDQPR
ncbi:MAG: hypothetical protein H6R40_1585, partial [Gemmatimonadetes bacterium]|nr:hypothetical protein [Gemmatimonadota bacterium]